MTKSDSHSDFGSSARVMILALAAIKAALESFDRGESNAFDTLDAICVEVEAHRAATTADSRRKQPRQGAA